MIEISERAVRPLGAYETIFARAQRGNFVMAASFAGTVQPDVWKRGLAKLVQRHPMLRVRLQEEEDDRTFNFQPIAGGNIRLWHGRHEEGVGWREMAGRWLAGRMGVDSDELVRVVVTDRDGTCDLLLGMHHSVGDGRSALGLLEDLMRAADGADLRPYATVPDVDHLLVDTFGDLATQASTDTPRQNWHTPFLPYDHPWTALETARLSAAETSQLIERARAEGTTVTGALAAAMVNGWRTAAPAWRTEPVRLMMPVDVRSRVGLDKELMLAISTTTLVLLPEQSNDFWELARIMKAAAAAALTDQALSGAASGRASAIQATRTKDDLDESSAKHAGWDLLLSNLGRWEPAYQGTALRLIDVWGPAALYGFEGERGLGAVTFNGELRLVLASRVQAPGLLDAIGKELCYAAR